MITEQLLEKLRRCVFPFCVILENRVEGVYTPLPYGVAQHQWLGGDIKRFLSFPEDPLALDILDIKMEFKAEPTEGPEEPASLESQEALSAPGTSASTAGKSASDNVAT